MLIKCLEKFKSLERLSQVVIDVYMMCVRKISRLVHQNRTHLFPFTLYSIHYPLIIPSMDAILSEVLKKTLNK